MRTLLAFFFFSVPLVAAEKPATVYVLLWFDTEDYILPASDDAALKVADWLKKENIRATFKIVGEKARTLETRKRQDVIDALKHHEIGYHSNFHSVHPTPAMYLSALGWDEGVAEFDRREKPGFDDVKRIFGQTPTCYGQPGSSWGPQAYGALRKWGVPVYLDYGRHVGVKRRPIYFDGVLNIYDHEHTLRTDLEPAALPKAKDRFVEVHKQLVGEGGGLVSIYYHPCEFVHKQFWDGANFDKGANSPREKWKLPAAKTAEETKAAYDTFFEYIRFIQRFAEVKFITASEAAALYKDAAFEREFKYDELKFLAGHAAKNVTFQSWETFALSPAEQLFLLNGNYSQETEGGPASRGWTLRMSPFGPSEASRPMAAKVVTDANQFLRTSRDVQEYLLKHGRVPSTVWMGSQAVTPEAYLQTLAKLMAPKPEGSGGPPMPMKEEIEILPAKLLTEEYVVDDPKKLWGWTIFPQGFDAPEMMKLAKRQAWTIKPAILRGTPK